MADKFYESCMSCDEGRIWKTNLKSVFFNHHVELVNVNLLLCLQTLFFFLFKLWQADIKNHEE